MSVKRLLIMSGACGVLASAISVALAQETNEVAEVVIVTGSYIRGTAEDAALPVDVITAEDLAKQGTPSTLDLIKSLTVSNGVLGDTNQFDARAQGSEGTGSVNLRGFGPTRTLVLLNGRRLVPSPFTGAVDTNLIPSSAIGRVEVLKDGAAATYGSDAIAGVVNFITKKNLKGLDLSADYKGISDSDGDWGANVSYGWRDERSSALISAGYQHRSELLVRDRDGAARPRNINPQGGWSAAGNPSTLVSIVPNAAGVPSIARVGVDPGCTTVGGEVGLSGATPVCYWQYTQFDALTEKEERYQIYGEYDYDITDSTRLHMEGLYADTRIPIYRTSPSYAALQAPSSLANGGTSFVQGSYTVAASSPTFQDFAAKNPGVFPPGTILAAIAANRPFALGGNPLFNYGSSEGPRDYQGMRFSTSLDGEFGNSTGWSVAYTYMKEDAHREGRDTVVNRYQLALRGLGGPNCTTNTPGTNGCFFINPFSTAIPAGANGGPVNPQFSPNFANNNLDVLNWMFPVVSTDQTTTINVIDAVLNGKTGITLPGGDLAWAFGGQYRRSTFQTQYSDLNNFAVTPCVNSVRTGIVGPSACTPAQLAAPTGALMFLGGSFNADLDQEVYAVFGELSVPITDTFQAQLAARYEDYQGEIGSTFDPKLSLRWQLFDAMALRGSVGTTFRGPLLRDVDPGSLTTLQNVKGTFRAIRTFGNPGLEPESATTFNVGMLVKAAGFSGSLDYWNFKFDNPINDEPLGDLVNKVFGAGTTCSVTDPLIGRFAFNDTNGNGVLDQAECVSSGITRVDINRVNSAKVETDGLDLSLQYDFDNVLGGSAAIGLNATYILKYDVGAQSISGVQVTNAVDAVGKLNYQTSSYPLPQWKGNLFAEYTHGPHNVRYVLNYIDSYEDQRADIFVASPSNPGGVAITAGRTIDKWITHDIHYLLDLPWQMTLSASVENFTDEDPPLARLDLSYDPFTASAIGRSYKVAVRKRFGGD